MRSIAESRPEPNIAYRHGTAQTTGLASSSVDVVLIVQAMHWMEPGPTLAEIGRILKPGGVLAVVDADWPPVSGIAAAEQAWARLHARIRVLEARLAKGDRGGRLRRPIDEDDENLADDDLADPHRNRLMPGGLRSWSKSDHLDRINASGLFSYTRELAFNEPVFGGAARFAALMYSQGSYQGLLKAQLTPDEIGAVEFDGEVQSGFSAALSNPQLSFSWRARIGVGRSG
jgi:SAM-dependent methyltransferase